MPSETVFINRKPEEVFAYVSDLPRHKEWAADTVDPVPVGDGPVGVGKRYVSNNHFRMGDVRDELEVDVYDSPRRFGFIATAPNYDVQHEFILTPQRGGTSVERVITVARAPFWFKLILPIADLAFAKASNTKSLQQLKGRLELMPSS